MHFFLSGYFHKGRKSGYPRLAVLLLLLKGDYRAGIHPGDQQLLPLREGVGRR